MEPAIHPDFLPMKFEGENILAVKINEISQNLKPCYYKQKGIFKGSYIRVGEQVGKQVPNTTNHKQVKYYRQKIIEYCKEPRNAKEISEYLGIKSRSYISINIIRPLLKLNLIEYTNKKSINASNQKYVSK